MDKINVYILDDGTALLVKGEDNNKNIIQAIRQLYEYNNNRLKEISIEGSNIYVHDLVTNKKKLITIINKCESIIYKEPKYKE